MQERDATTEEWVEGWQRWVEQAIGGPRERILVAQQAALEAFDAGQRPDQISETAQRAAAAWDSEHGGGDTGIGGQDEARDEARQQWLLQWQQWVQQAIGGPPQRIQVAQQAALEAIDAGKNPDEIRK